MVIDLTSDFGKRADTRLHSEEIIWLITTGADGTPQPSPVWFLYDGTTILIYSQPNQPKVRNIARNPHVALHLDGDGRGGNIVVLTGTATVDANAPPQPDFPAYLEKYADGIKGIGLTPESMIATYSTVIRVTPTKLRGH